MKHAPNLHIPRSAPSHRRVFQYNPSEHSHLRFVLEKVKGGRNTDILAYGDLPFLHEGRPAEPQSIDATFALVRYRGKGSLPGPEEGHVELVAMVIPLDASNTPITASPGGSAHTGSGGSKFQLQTGSFQLQPEIGVDNWWPVTLPMDYGEQKGFMATHRSVTANATT